MLSGLKPIVNCTFLFNNELIITKENIFIENKLERGNLSMRCPICGHEAKKVCEKLIDFSIEDQGKLIQYKCDCDHLFWDGLGGQGCLNCAWREEHKDGSDFYCIEHDEDVDEDYLCGEYAEQGN